MVQELGTPHEAQDHYISDVREFENIIAGAKQSVNHEEATTCSIFKCGHGHIKYMFHMKYTTSVCKNTENSDS